jgi:dTDP-4-dehydrorhamnose 3,5-epimerase
MNPVKLIPPVRHGDDRGWFTEVYNEETFAGLGVVDRFVQDNHSWSQPAGVLRGLHFQTPPFAQAKLVRCIRGAILDVAVDVRRGSPTFGRWVGATLSAENGCQLYVPVGFAHGFLTLEPDTEVTYKVSALYAKPHDSGLAFDDPDIGVAWPLAAGREPILSAKDEALRSRRLAGFDSPFPYDGRPLLPVAGGVGDV